jgi:hypothetical protein
MNTKTIHTVKLTNKVEKYTMVKLFSTDAKAFEFTEEFFNSLEVDDKDYFNTKWSVDIEPLTVDEL